MTKKELKDKYLAWNREITKCHDRERELNEELRKITKYETGEASFMNPRMNVNALAGTSKEYRAWELYDEIVLNRGKWEALRDLALATNNFEI